MILDWCPSPKRRGIPRRSCDSSQQADRVGLIRTHGSTFVQRARSLCCNKAAGGCAIIRIFFRETGMPVHTGTAMQLLLHPLNYGRKYQHQSSEPVIRYYGLTALMVAGVIVRVACWFLEQ